MTRMASLRNLLLLAIGAIVGGLVVSQWTRPVHSRAPDAGADPKTSAIDLAALQADVTRLKGVVPSQAHVMADAGTHFGNLWFAAQEENWPLALFYFNETRARALWTIRINPMPKATTGEIVDLKGIFDGIDADVLAPLKQTIEKRERAQFVVAYKTALESCYACHKALGRAYLRPGIPKAPSQTIINADPDATWPR